MRWLVLVVILGACGDDREKLEVFEPTNGTRLTIEQYQFEDGTRLVQPAAFYDRGIHARCTPQEWIDGVIRCVPDAEEALYRDASCETLFGVANAIEFPTHFVANDTRDGVRLPSRVFRAGEKTDEVITEFYLHDGETCVGPALLPEPGTKTAYYALGGELGTDILQPITETEIGDGRIGLVIRQSNDGAVVPLGFHDRDLDLACTPAPRGTGPGVCEPAGVTTSTVFSDTGCTQPAIVVGEDELPAIASIVAEDGCLAYRALDPTPGSRAYRRDGDACVLAATGSRVFTLGAPVELAAITRTPDATPKRRVQRILASVAGDSDVLHVYADRLFDSATRAECRLARNGDSLRCLPTTLAPLLRLYQPDCITEIVLAEVPARTCEPVAFAGQSIDATVEVRAIGDVFTGTAYLPTFEGCVPYAATADTELHTVGPPLRDDLFVSAVPFGAR